MSIMHEWWLPFMPMSVAFASMLVGFAGRHARAQQVAIYTDLRARGAESPATACIPARATSDSDRALASLVRRGLLCQEGADRFYVSTQGLARARTREKWVLLLTFVVIFAAAALTLMAMNGARHSA